ncbi:DUF4031 domain-containing protein [Nesterenkonia salmonea]|uniref:DUF4031 domain-containing protein n=1 Tax=Nesterenkonia salmonea TaxID=1804987 RepID=A0A5R9BB30_9MICC|nr:DUF4031 domain-containing protein [Nesterenkonia salmonea]TLP97432.1 DUF4031 domain-containing protein [Nesterenkonia salmonea]
MAIFIDPPVWPAHETVFSHVISDVSLQELHLFARNAAISDRAFDRDHYDVPAHRFDDLIALGAIPVSGHELARRLSGSGLRVKARERPEKVRRGLLHRWQKLSGHANDDAAREAWETVGRDLLARWSEPHRHYHALPHLVSVLRVSSLLERSGEVGEVESRLVALAGWFHDAVYAGAAGQDEEDSAQLAQQRLDTLLPDVEISEVTRLVRLTATHTPRAGDVAGAVLSDADLEVLGRDRAEYRRYATQVRADYAHVPEENFSAGRVHVLQGLLSSTKLFHTSTGYSLWEAAARRNVEAELNELERGG